MPDLVHAVQELNEARRPIAGWSAVVCASLLELVAERKPILANESLEALKSPEVWVYEDLNNGSQLSSAVPSIRAVDQDVLLFNDHCVQDVI